MIESDKKHCQEFAQLVLGKSIKKSEVDAVINGCESFKEFRVILIVKFKDSVESLRRVTDQWRDSIRKTKVHSDGNHLTHMAEILAMKQAEIERKLRESAAEMIDKLQTIDTLTTRQTKLNDKLSEMGELIAQFRNQITPNETVSPIDDGQASHLMHTLELLTIRQSEIQQKLRESTVEMLDKLKAIDSLATMQVNMRSRNSEINDLVGQFRKQISLIDHRTQLQK